MADKVTVQDIVERLKQIKYPGVDHDIVSIGLVKNVHVTRHSEQNQSSTCNRGFA